MSKEQSRIFHIFHRQIFLRSFAAEVMGELRIFSVEAHR